MSEKQNLIKQMIAMQKKFIEFEHQNGVGQEEYIVPQEGHVLHNYRDQYAEMAGKVIDLAHAEKNSKR